MFLVRRIVGDSMLPTFRHDRLVIGMRFLRIHPEDVVIVRHNNREKIKRIAKMSDGQVFVLGDNPDRSTDSRVFGWIPRNTVIARVVWPKAHKKA